MNYQNWTIDQGNFINVLQKKNRRKSSKQSNMTQKNTDPN